MKLNSKQLRVSSPSNEDIKNLKRNPIYLILDNVLDTYNIGSLFRLADATGVAKVYLCGRMEYPPSSRVHKAAVGTENWVPWTTKSSALQAVRKLKRENEILKQERDILKKALGIFSKDRVIDINS